MQRTEISWVVIQLKALGIDDVLHFDFLSPPPADAMIYALELLFALGALDSECRLTRVGEIMAEMPIEPRMSKCLLSSVDMGCSEDILSIVAMCSVEYPFITQRSKASQESKDRLMECVSHFTVLEGDHMTLLRIYKEFLLNKSDHQWCDSMCLQHRILSRAKELRSRLALMMKSFSPEGTIFSSCEDDTETIRKCLVSGYFSNAAQLGAGGKYWTIRGHVSVDLHANCVFSRFGTLPEWVIFHDVIHTSNICIREVSRIEPRWLLELAQHYYHSWGKR
jgi:ATP-dependent RNA helicase DDX35